DRCSGGAAAIAGVWDDAAKGRVRDAFRKTGRATADEAFARVDATLQRRLGDWAHGHREACEAALVRHEQSEAMFDRRMDCLGQAGGWGAARGSAEGRALDRSWWATGAVGDVAACADITALGDAVPPPRDPAARAEVDALRDELAHVLTLRRLGKVKEGLPAA